MSKDDIYRTMRSFSVCRSLLILLVFWSSKRTSSVSAWTSIKATFSSARSLISYAMCSSFNLSLFEVPLIWFSKSWTCAVSDWFMRVRPVMLPSIVSVLALASAHASCSLPMVLADSAFLVTSAPFSSSSLLAHCSLSRMIFFLLSIVSSQPWIADS